uniref:Uncharacterized protein n=1 Tax=Salmonella enterica TaxID=28901 RepID=A0A750KMK9_SALER
MNDKTFATVEILITSDVLSRYKISRSTLYYGSPKRWRLSDLLEWEEKVGIKPDYDQSASQDGSAIPQANVADHQCSHEGYTVP